jgi:hypothetical protein
LLGPTFGVLVTDTTQKGLGFLLEDLVTPARFCFLIKPQFLARICITFLLGGLNNTAPINVSGDSLVGFFDYTEIGKDNFEKISK